MILTPALSQGEEGKTGSPQLVIELYPPSLDAQPPPGIVRAGPPYTSFQLAAHEIEMTGVPHRPPSAATYGCPINRVGSASDFGTSFWVRPSWLSEP